LGQGGSQGEKLLQQGDNPKLISPKIFMY